MGEGHGVTEQDVGHNTDLLVLVGLRRLTGSSSCTPAWHTTHSSFVNDTFLRNLLHLSRIQKCLASRPVTLLFNTKCSFETPCLYCNSDCSLVPSRGSVIRESQRAHQHHAQMQANKVYVG